MVDTVLLRRDGPQPASRSHDTEMATYLGEYRWVRETIRSKLEKPLSLDDLVFPSIEGKPMDPGVLSHNFTRIVGTAGLEGIRFHDLRHTFASLMLMRGAKPKVISEALGHASVGFTLDTYSHIIEGMQQEAMALLDEVMPAGMSSRKNPSLNCREILAP